MGKNTKKKVFLTDEQKQELCKMVGNKSTKEIAEIFDVCESQVRKIKKQNNLTKNVIIVTDDIREEVKKLRSEGMKLQDISDKVGISLSSVSVILSGKDYKTYNTKERNDYPVFEFSEGCEHCYDNAKDCKNFFGGKCGCLENTIFINKEKQRIPCPFYTTEGHRQLRFVIKGNLPSMNEYIEACRKNAKYGAKFKAEWQSSVAWIIRVAAKNVKFQKPVKIKYKFFEKNKKRDLDNIAGFGHKIIQDALVERGVLHNDGWNYIKGYTDEFYVSVNNPRIEVEIYE